MKHSRRCWIIIGTGLIIAAGLFLAGCEVDSASSTIEITPDSVVLTEKGQSVTLTCIGGYECTWSLATESYGMLNTRRGIQVVYTSQYKPAAGSDPALQIVTVASKFTTMSAMEYDATLAGATNIPTTNTQYATAYITHLPAETSTVFAVSYTPEALTPASSDD